MGVKKISISLDEEILERAKGVADAEGVSLSAWLSNAATEAADLAAKAKGWEEYFAMYGEPTAEEMQETYDRMKAEGHFEPESPEHLRMRMAALARLHEPFDPDADAEQDRRAG